MAHGRKILLIAAAAATLTFAFAACGGGDDDGGGDATATRPAATAAAGSPTSAATSAATAAATSTASSSETPSTGDGTTLTLVAKNTLWDKDELEAPAGPITIILDNQDPGVAHNLEVYKGEDENGELMGATEIVNGPSKQELKLTLEAGEYFYWCVVHPATMMGELKVE